MGNGILSVLLSVLLILFAAYVGLLALYIICVTLASWFRVRIPQADTSQPSIAVLIPAHNEEGQIKFVLESLFANNYAGVFKPFVIADNCTDRTADLAVGAGAQVLKRNDPQNPGKGQAINWALREQGELLKDYDYIAFVDADTEVDKHFLAGVRDALSLDGIDVMQGFHSVLNAADNWRTSFTYLGFAGINHIRPAGQFRLGASAGIKGNGMAFKTSLLLEMGWPAHSIVEDLEISLILLFEDKRIAYNGDAIVRSEMPVEAEQADTQRERWEGGRYQIIRAYLPRLWSSFLRSGRWKYIDALLDLLVPPFTLMLLLAALAIAAGWLFNQSFTLQMGILGIAAIAVYCLSALLQTRAPWQVWKNLLAAPLFLLWKIPLSLKLLGSRQKNWNRTTRKDELK